MGLLIDSPAFMEQFERDVASAERSVCVQTMSFEGDEAGRRLAGALESRPDLERTLIVDRYSLYDVNDRFLPWPPNACSPALWRELAGTLRVTRRLSAGGVTVCWTNPVGLLCRKFVGRNHKKLVLVDDRIAYFGGINVCDHNFGWHDVMLRVEDPELGAFLREDVRATLRGENLPRRARSGDVEILLLDGVRNEELNEPVFALIRDPRLVEEYRRDVLEPDLAQSVAPSREVAPWLEWSKHRGILGGMWLTVRLSRLGRARPPEGRASPVPQPAVED
jgi:cardiolipin synthase